jgi:hypothetical protein
MTRPSAFERLLGWWPVATPLMLACPVLVYGWYTDHTAWWVALFSLVMAYKALVTAGKVQRYKVWAEEWQAMGPEGERAAKPSKKGGGRKVYAWCFGLLAAIAVYLWLGHNETVPLDESLALALLWTAVALVAFMALFLFSRLGWKVLAGIWVFARSTSPAKARTKADAPVSWLLGRTSSSFSRKASEKQLPAYCVQLMRRETSQLDAAQGQRLSA